LTLYSLVTFSNVDIYGERDEDGTGTVWDYANSYSYRKPGSGRTTTFDASQWIFGNASPWTSTTPVAEIKADTTPGRHRCLPTMQPSVSPSAKPSQKPSAGPTLNDKDDDAGCNNITILNFFWKWFVCLIKWLF
jgi:hypothetical protein